MTLASEVIPGSHILEGAKMSDKVVVRVNANNRLYEEGASRFPGDEFRIERSRLGDLGNAVTLVEPPVIHTTAIAAPSVPSPMENVASPNVRDMTPHSNDPSRQTSKKSSKKPPKEAKKK